MKTTNKKPVFVLSGFVGNTPKQHMIEYVCSIISSYTRLAKYDSYNMKSKDSSVGFSNTKEFKPRIRILFR